MIKGLFKRIYLRVVGKPAIKYKAGKCFYSNSLIDTLFPELIVIGDNFTSAPGSIILSHDASLINYCGKYRVQKTIIGNRVFLGANSVVLPGVIIGDDVIIGSGTIVTKNIPSNSVVCGNPAKIIGTPMEYMEKCIDREILFDINHEFLSLMNKGEGYTEKDLDKLRCHIYKQIRKVDDK